jgi:hypothetical protein
MVEQKQQSKRVQLFILLLMLTMIVIGAVVFWQISRPSTPSITNHPTNTNKLTPRGFTEFKDTTVGFRLAYPTNWGEPYAAHLVARDSNGKELGPLYRWRFKNKPNVYIFAPRLPGALAIPANGPTSFYSGYSYDFTKQGNTSYCISYTRSKNDKPDCDSKELQFIQSYNYNNVRSLIRNYYTTRSPALNEAFFAPNNLISGAGADTRLQEVDMLNVLDSQATYPSVSVEILDSQDADMSNYLDQAKTIAKTVQSITKINGN